MIVLPLWLSMPLRTTFATLGSSASKDIAYVGSAVGTAWGHGGLDFQMFEVRATSMKGLPKIIS
jgi:hypothetical protein